MNTESKTVPAIERTLQFEASPDRVWSVLTEPAELAGWFPDGVVELEAAADSAGWLVWDEHGRYAIRIEVFEPPQRLVWQWARTCDTALKGGPTTTVEWTLEASEGGGTTLHLRESGFLTPEDREQNVGGWTHELAELEELLGC